MNTTGKLAIGFSLASSLFLTAWLLTGERKTKTKDFVSKKVESLRGVLKTDRVLCEESDAYYYI